MEWSVVDRAALKAESDEGPYGRRICRVFHPKGKADDIWRGTYGDAIIDIGPPGYQYGDGSIVTL